MSLDAVLLWNWAITLRTQFQCGATLRMAGCISFDARQHAFHFHCISRWLKTRNVCPLDNREWEMQKCVYPIHSTVSPSFISGYASPLTMLTPFRDRQIRALELFPRLGNFIKHLGITFVLLYLSTSISDPFSRQMYGFETLLPRRDVILSRTLDAPHSFEKLPVLVPSHYAVCE